MGTFCVEAMLAAPERPERREPIELFVDSGSIYTWVAAATLHALSVAPTERRQVMTIEGQVTERDEGFGLGIDPVQRELIPIIQYGAAAA